MSCPQDKVRNPETGRCVKRGGKVHKDLIQRGLVPRSPPAAEAAAQQQEDEKQTDLLFEWYLEFMKKYFPRVPPPPRVEPLIKFPLAPFILFNLFLSNYSTLEYETLDYLEQLLFKQHPLRKIPAAEENALPAPPKCMDLVLFNEITPKNSTITFIYKDKSYCLPFRYFLETLYDESLNKLFVACRGARRFDAGGKLYLKLDLEYPLYIPYSYALQIFEQWPKAWAVHLFDSSESLTYISNVSVFGPNPNFVSTEHCTDRSRKQVVTPKWCTSAHCRYSNGVWNTTPVIPANHVSRFRNYYRIED